MFNRLPRVRHACGAFAIVIATAGMAQVCLPEVAETSPRGEPGDGRTSAPGGLRAAAADLCWLRAYAAWEQRDGVSVRRWLRNAVAADPRVLHFWLHAARILAFDLPQWGPPSRAAQLSLSQEALNWLELARSQFPAEPGIWIEEANIHLYARGDIDAAARCYRAAAELPGAPFFAGRIYGELLGQMGRDREAYAWLCSLHRQWAALPGTAAELAMPDLVLSRIRQLEARLRIVESAAYLAPNS